MTSKTDPKEPGTEARNIADETATIEELVEARMRMMRKKSEEMIKRQKEIEEDRKNANMYSEMAIIKKHQEHSGASGVFKEEGPAAGRGRGRGRGRGIMLTEMQKETLKAKQWEVKRRENVQREEQEQKQGSKTSGSMSSFLADDNRVDMSRTTGRNEHSWGGANFNKVVNRVQREKDGRNRGHIEMAMSGKERQQYSQWREERMKIDEERKTRQKMSGNWSRAWDQKKIWDSRKKMWVCEDEADDYNDKSTRWQESDNSEEWDSDNRNSRRDNRSHHGKGEQGSRQSFVQHDNRDAEASEEWSDTNEEGVTQNKDTDTILHHQHDAVSGVHVGVGEDWD